jgi:hypothetical protein
MTAPVLRPVLPPAAPVKRIKGVVVEINGDPVVFPPLSLGALEQLRERLVDFTGDPSDAAQVSTVIDAAHASLRRNDPALTREAVAEIIDLGNMIEVFEAVMDAGGLRRKAQEAAGGETTPGE